MVIYFSGTGNSEYCAEFIGAKLGYEAVNSFDYVKNQIRGEFTAEEPWVFVAPTYCWQLPHIFEDFIKKSSFEIMISSIFSSRRSSSLYPSPLKNLIPLYSYGLWEALITIPASAL